MMDEDCKSISIPEKLSDPQHSKTRCLVILLNAAAICGLLDGMLPEAIFLSVFLKIFMAVLLAFAVLVWCIIDARENRFTISFRLLLGLILLYPLGFPYYIFKTRRNSLALKTLAWALLFFLLLGIFYVIAYAVGDFIYSRIYC